MQATSFDPKRRSDVLPGMYVHILTDNQEQLEGIVKKTKGEVDYHPQGIKVVLSGKDGIDGKIGRAQKIEIPKDNALLLINAQRQLKTDLAYEENNNLEYKGSFQFDSDRPEHKAKFLQKSVVKTIQAFANADGGRLYIGIHDKTHKPLGLSGDYTFLKEGKQDLDGFEIDLLNFLADQFFIRGEIYNSVSIVPFQYEGEDVCLIEVKSSDVAFLTQKGVTCPECNCSSKGVQNEVYVRKGGSSQPKTITEFLNYWPKHLDEKRKKKLEFWK